MLKPCVRVTGPFDSKLEAGVVVGCLYNFDQSKCADETFDWWQTIPYFGGGGSKLSLPTTLVGKAFASCGLSMGPDVNASNRSESASLIIGRFATCSASQGAFLASKGLIFHPDGTFQFLIEGSSGEFVPDPACNRTGLWGFPYAADVEQISMFVDEGEYSTVLNFHGGTPRYIDLYDAVLVAIE